MNIDKVYICDIYRLDDIVYNDINTTVDKGDGFNTDDIFRIRRKISFEDKALVYYSVMRGGFIGMETGQFYRLGYPSTRGELFVDVHKSKIYGKTLMDSDRKHYSKKKILKRYKEYKDGGREE